MKMGHDKRGKQPVSTPTIVLPAGTLVSPTQSVFDMIAEALKDMKPYTAEVPLTTMVPSCQCPAPTIVEQKVVERIETVKEISTTDRRARRYTMATRTELHKALDRKHALLNRAIEIQREKSEKMVSRLNVLEQAKPQEKQVVIEKTEVVTKTPTLMMVGLAVSLALNVLILIIK
jgi:hypothetical protein